MTRPVHGSSPSPNPALTQNTSKAGPTRPQLEGSNLTGLAATGAFESSRRFTELTKGERLPTSGNREFTNLTDGGGAKGPMTGAVTEASKIARTVFRTGGGAGSKPPPPQNPHVRRAGG